MDLRCEPCQHLVLPLCTQTSNCRLKLGTQLHDFFVETLGHISLAFLELDYCDGGDLHELILASGRGDGDGETTHRDLLSTPTAFGSKSSGGIAKMGDDGGSREKGAGLPAEQIAKLTLGLLEGLQRLHEVRTVPWRQLPCLCFVHHTRL